MKITRLGIAFALSALALAQKDRVRVVQTHELPQLDGGHLKATLAEVTFAPGEVSQQHSHPCPVLVYVVQGAIRAKINSGPETVYHAGESFYEAPFSLHAVSANASATESAKFVAFAVCDREGPLSIPASEAKQ